MTEKQEIKAKSLELAIASLALFPQKVTEKKMKRESVAAYVIALSDQFEEYLQRESGENLAK